MNYCFAFNLKKIFTKISDKFMICYLIMTSMYWLKGFYDTSKVMKRSDRMNMCQLVPPGAGYEVLESASKVDRE